MPTATLSTAKFRRNRLAPSGLRGGPSTIASMSVPLTSTASPSTSTCTGAPATSIATRTSPTRGDRIHKSTSLSSQSDVGLVSIWLPRVLEYSSTTRVIFYYSITRYFLLPVANFHFRLQFSQSVDELLKFMKIWGFSILFQL